MGPDFKLDFEQFKTGKFSEAETEIAWNNAQLLCGKKDYLFYKLGITPHPLYISEENNNHILRADIPGQFVGPITGSQWKLPFVPCDECYLSYRLKFTDGFDFVKGGKLPGLAGGIGNCGGDVPDGTDGWSARLMFWENGKLSVYAYYPKQSSKWGERFFLEDSNLNSLKISTGVWHQIVQHIKMNSPGKPNGIIQAWFDGKEAFSCDTILFRTDPKLQIDQVFFSVFLGGDDSTWAAKKNESIYFDDFHISTQPIK